jgi:hypothetical protein
LYNLIGEHRRKLSTDYAADPVQRFVDVLTFTRDFESLTSDEGLKIIRLLMKLFDLRASEILEDSSKTRSLTFTIKIHLLGRVKVGLASTELLAVRKQYMILWDTPAYQFRKVLSHTNTSKTEWRLAGVATSSLLPNYIPSYYLVHFNMNDRQIHGVASTLPDSKEMVWHIPETPFVFVVRRITCHNVVIVGRALSLKAEEDPSLSVLEARMGMSIDYSERHHRTRDVTLDLHTLIEMLQLSTSLTMPVEWDLSHQGDRPAMNVAEVEQAEDDSQERRQEDIFDMELSEADQ